MSDAALRARLVSLIKTATGSNQVHETRSTIKTEQDLITILGVSDGGGGTVLNGWVVSSAEIVTNRITTAGWRSIERTFRILGYRTDSETAEAEAAADLDLIEDGLMGVDAFMAMSPPCELTELSLELEPASLAGMQVWESTVRVVVTEYRS